jgi:2-enoate reductase
MVAGGGPGGMVAAFTAAQRGHEVTLYEAKGVLGGDLIPGGTPPFKSDILRLLDYWKNELDEAGVEVRLNTPVTPELVRREKPDGLVVAIGADVSQLPIPGIERAGVLTAVTAFERAGELAGKTVVVIGGGDVGCECAVYLAQLGSRVTIVEMLDELLQTEDIIWIKLDLLKMVRDAGVQVLTGAKVTEIRAGEVAVQTPGGAQNALPADAVVVAAGMVARQALAHQLAGECADVYIIGDCRQPRRIRDAVVEGDRAARLL